MTFRKKALHLLGRLSLTSLTSTPMEDVTVTFRRKTLHLLGRLSLTSLTSTPMEDIRPALSRSKRLKVTEFFSLTFAFLLLSYIVYIGHGLDFASIG